MAELCAGVNQLFVAVLIVKIGGVREASHAESISLRHLVLLFCVRLFRAESDGVERAIQVIRISGRGGALEDAFGLLELLSNPSALFLVLGREIARPVISQDLDIFAQREVAHVG